MEIKRDAAGVVDAISAEDIGKFPDTNLAESLQRITGISIERRDGEGAQVTARGFGPQFNMVTLNGRQIPGADAFGAAGQVAIGGVDGGTRAFNFSQLASEAISALEVYKTSQANVPSGGIGATINIQTDKPFNHTGMVASAGAKAVSDESQPFDNDITPELSGIFSCTNDDKTFGVGMSASYQKRHGGSVQATENYWNIQRVDRHRCPVRPDCGERTGHRRALCTPERPALRVRRFRTRAHQWPGGGAVRADRQPDLHPRLHLLDQRDRRESWRAEHVAAEQPKYTDIEFDTSGAVATPIYIREIAGTKDFGLEQQRSMQKYKLGSLGFNALWDVSERLQPELRRAQVQDREPAQ